jgi:cob(I)alamin adenosyltransferase
MKTKIYTKTGDSGKTSIKDCRINKSSEVIEAIGSIDELDAFVGDAIVKCFSLRDLECSDEIECFVEVLKQIQRSLYVMNSVLSGYKEISASSEVSSVTVDVTFLETKIDEYTDACPELTHFIRPGVTELDAKLHICRAMSRRAERNIWIYLDSMPAENSSKCIYLCAKYVNRLSDFFFAAARYVTLLQGHQDEIMKL